MAYARQVTLSKRRSFARIIAQLDKTTAKNKIVKIVEQATKFLHDEDIGWDAINIRVPADYVLLSQRKKKRVPNLEVGQAKAAAALNGSAPLGFDGRALLKSVVCKHPEWPTVRDAMEVDISHISAQDLLAVAQLLKIDEKFLKLFVESPEAVTPQAELPLNGSGK